MVGPLETANTLQQHLLELVDEDAAVYLAFVAAEPGSSARQAMQADVAATPSRIGRTCLEVLQLVSVVEPQVRGPMRFDVGAAAKLALAPAQSSLEIAEYNLRLVSDSEARHALQTEIAKLRDKTV
jgi:formiminotetrahydrofolate cyclodeaminase